MPFTPYTSQTILPSANGVVDQQQQQQQQQPTSFFTRRPTATSPVGSPPDVNPSLPPSPPSRFNTLLPSGSNVASTSFTIDAVEAWGKTTLVAPSMIHFFTYSWMLIIRHQSLSRHIGWLCIALYTRRTIKTRRGVCISW